MMLPRCLVWGIGSEPSSTGRNLRWWTTRAVWICFPSRCVGCFLRIADMVRGPSPTCVLSQSPFFRLDELLVGSRYHSSYSSAWQILIGFRTFFGSVSCLYPSSDTRSYPYGQHRLILQIDMNRKSIHVSTIILLVAGMLTAFKRFLDMRRSPYLDYRLMVRLQLLASIAETVFYPRARRE